MQDSENILSTAVRNVRRVPLGQINEANPAKPAGVVFNSSI